MIKINQLSKSFDGFKALDQVDLSIPSQCVYGLIGPNGSGKSTLIKHLIGSYRQDSGTILYDGQPVYENVAVKQRLFYVPDKMAFQKGETLKTVKKKYESFYPYFNNRRYESLMSRMNINENQWVIKMPQGVIKEMMLWMALSCMPDFLILDEPLEYLDISTKIKLWEVLSEDVRERGTTVIIASHHLKDLEDICTAIGILIKGKMAFESDLSLLKRNLIKVQLSTQLKFVHLPPSDHYQVIYQKKMGSVIQMIIRGEIQSVKKELDVFQPYFIDELPLSLEEILIFDIGGENDDVQQLFV